ncbi:hypothetical protein [Catellatospora bangladeshensis]|uniref:Uncharacterized protein n=1 Tax=Catellatospora bangladeshensis TaxID=310355 RepID=A0A8J3JTB8_9ACTN|nr:hypothetical protein [Catellatospora bangladeshensis]GIF83404.1 hypothetical protein Cba03nite_47530 [Catellatospora bangladeshensis]
MLEFVLFLVVFAPAPLLAIVVLTVRLRAAAREGGVRGFGARTVAALRGGTRRPAGRALLGVAAAAALLTAALEQAYLASVAEGPGWGTDVALLTVVLGLLALLGCGALAALAAAAVARVRGFGAGTVTGLLSLVAIAAGTAAAHLPLQALYRADPAGFPTVPNLGEGDLLLPFQVFLVSLTWALPWPVLGAGYGARPAPAGARPAARDLWQLLLDLATADLPASRAAWGAALRAELAAIDPPAERRRFALGGVWAALRAGRAPGAWAPALAVAGIAAAAVFAASRWSLAHERGGVLSYWISVPATLLFLVALGTAWRQRSFGAGLRTGALAGLAAMPAVLAVSIPEAVVWFHRRAGYLSTGDAVPPSWQDAVNDVLRPEFLLGMVVFWVIGAAGGAGLGAALARLRTPGVVGS